MVAGILGRELCGFTRCARRIVFACVAAVVLAMGMPMGSSAAVLAPTPYMGWNTYYGVGGHFNEATIKSVADSLISSGLAGAGYKIVWLDYGWATGARDSNGNLVVDASQWPDGMSGLTSWLHAQGLYAGIYTAVFLSSRYSGRFLHAKPGGCAGACW